MVNLCKKSGKGIPKESNACGKCGSGAGKDSPKKPLAIGISICAVLFITGVVTVLFATGSIRKKNKAIQPISYPKSMQEEKKEQVADKGQGDGAALPITAKSAVLIENSSGRILYEKNKDKEVIPASITKIMTLLLIFDALDERKISLKDSVTVSDYAAKMGGSQVFLEPGETQTVKDMIKCISIASANDAAVAMAEYVAGSEQEFVKRMNAKAKELGMRHTRFKNCNGLDDTIKSGHYSSAYDVALMSQALVTRHPDITKYSTVWMDEITHKTKKGESVFGLTNTNKLIRTYDGITGLKTGSTSKAKYCLSATAKRGGVSLTAVVMAAPDHKVRFSQAASLLDYGFANCSNFRDKKDGIPLKEQPVKGGTKTKIVSRVEKDFSITLVGEEKPEDLTRKITYRKNLSAPVKEGEVIGSVTYLMGEKNIGEVPIHAAETIEKATFLDYVKKVYQRFVFN